MREFLPRRMTALWLLAVSVWAAWGPFAGVGARPRLAVLYVGGPGDIAANLFLLAPLAVLLAIAPPRGMWGARRPLLAIAVLSGVLEGGQLALGGRFVQVSDIGLNVLGAALAMAGARAMVRAGFDAERLASGAAVLTVLVTVGVLVGYTGHVHGKLHLPRWAPDAAVGSALRLRAGPEVRAAEAQLCAGTRAAARCVSPGAGADLLAEVARLAQRSQRVYATADVVRDPGRGQAPLLRFSAPQGPLLDLWRLDDRLVLRLHTGLTTGTARPQFVLPRALPADTPARVAIGFDNGAIRMVSGTQRSQTRGDYRFGLLRSWVLVRSPRFLTPQGLARAGLVAALVLCIPIGIASACIFPGRRSPVVGGVIALGSLASSDVLVRIEPSASEWLVVAAIGAAAAWLTNRERSRAAGAASAIPRSRSPAAKGSGMRGIEHVAWLYDGVLWLAERAGLLRWRRVLVCEARGCTLEIGVGTGRNLPLYPPGTFVTGLDPDRILLARARRRCPGVGLVAGRAEALPFRDHAFATVVASLVFCSVDDPARAFAEVRRVLEPGGRLRMMEHVRASSPFRARLQDWIQPIWTSVTGGCRPNRDTEALVVRSGFRIDPATRRARGDLRLVVADLEPR